MLRALLANGMFTKRSPILEIHSLLTYLRPFFPAGVERIATYISTLFTYVHIESHIIISFVKGVKQKS